MENRKTGMNKNFEKGLSLIEASMVLALSAIVVAGVMYYYTSAAENNTNQNTIALIETIVSKVNALYANQSTTQGLNTKMIAKQIPGVKTLVDRGGFYILIPGRGAGNIRVRPTMNNDNTYSIDFNNDDSSVSLDEIYSQCMLLTGGRFGSSFIGYKNDYTSGDMQNDQSISARSSFCKKQGAGHTGSNISLFFRT